MIEIIRRLFSRRTHRSATRLSQQDVLAIAATAATDALLADLMTITSVEQRDGRLIWHIGSATVGSGLTVTVDDATGEVIERKTWGVR
jgi:hypothetical protein